MNVLIIHKENEDDGHINILKNVLLEKGINSQSIVEDKKLHFTSNHQSWIRDCVLGYDMDGNKRYDGFMLIGRYMDDFAYKFVEMAMNNEQSLWFVDQGKIKKINECKMEEDRMVVNE